MMRFIQWRRVLSVAVLILLAFAVARAAQFRFQEREDAFRKECAAQRQKLGAAVTWGDLKARYPTPELQFDGPAACVMPGATAEMTVKGRFTAGSRIFIHNDNIEVVKENVAANVYRATIKAPPDLGPQTASIAVVQEVTGQTTTSPGAVIVVGGRYEWTINASNGWKIVARSKGTAPCPTSAEDRVYEVSFFRAGETTPFETMTGKLGFDLYSSSANYHLSLEAAGPAGTENYTALMQKMGDRTLTMAQRQQLMKQIEAAQKEMMAGLEKMRDPAYIKAQQEKEQQFGCRNLGMKVVAGKVTGGYLNCAQKVGRPTLTGTMGLVK